MRATGAPTAIVIDHSRACRAWGGGAAQLLAIFPRAQVTLSGPLRSFAGLEGDGRRQSCARCHTHVSREHPSAKGSVSLCGGLLADHADGGGGGFQPECHVHYSQHDSQALVPARDGLPKYAQLPSQLGGTGELLAEGGGAVRLSADMPSAPGSPGSPESDATWVSP